MPPRGLRQRSEPPSLWSTGPLVCLPCLPGQLFNRSTSGAPPPSPLEWAAFRRPIRATSVFRPSAEPLCGRPRRLTLKPMNPKLRYVLQVLCCVVWAGTLCSTVPDHSWPESLTRQVWANVAIHVVAVGSLWAAWRLSPDRPRTWKKNRYYVLVGLVTVAGIGCGLSPWAWENITVRWSYLIFVGLCCLAHQIMCWRDAKQPTS